MIEAFACGVPVIAYPHGSVPEIIEHGVNGFIVHNQKEAIQAAMHIDQSINRADCRACFEARFTASAMVRNYLQLYQRLLPRADFILNGKNHGR